MATRQIARKGIGSNGNTSNWTEKTDRTEAESAAAELVVADLRERGRVVSLRGRPDQEQRNKRAVDFLLDLDGTEAALEITDFYPTQRDGERGGIGRWFADRLRSDLLPLVEDRQLGAVNVYVTLPLTPDRRRLGNSVVDIAAAILEALPAEGTAVLSDDWDTEPLFSRIRMFRWPDRPSRIEVLHQPHASYVEPAVRTFLDHAIPRKAVQTAGYEHVILAAFDRSFVGDVEAFQAALRIRANELPENWDAVYFVTPVGRGCWRAWLVWSRLGDRFTTS